MVKFFKNSISKSKKKTSYKNKDIIGLIIFILIFLLLIPYIIYNLGYYYLLQAYLPNVDLIANILTWQGGPYDMWTRLYLISPITVYGFISQTLINYLALLGVTFLISKETLKTNSIKKGWSLAFIMLLMTYLLPSRFISFIMKKMYKFIENKSNYTSDIVYSFTMLFGSIITILIIVMESFLIKKYKYNLESIADFFISIFPKFIKN